MFGVGMCTAKGREIEDHLKVFVADWGIQQKKSYKIIGIQGKEREGRGRH